MYIYIYIYKLQHLQSRCQHAWCCQMLYLCVIVSVFVSVSVVVSVSVCAYVQVYVFMYVCIYICTHINICVFLLFKTQVLGAFIDTYIRIQTHSHTHTYTHTHTHTHTYTYTYTYTCMFLHVLTSEDSTTVLLILMLHFVESLFLKICALQIMADLQEESCLCSGCCATL